MIVEHLRDGQLNYELDKADELRTPPVPVIVWLPLDAREWAGEPYGWATNPNGSDVGWRGLVRLTRDFAPGFLAEGLHWVPAEKIRPLNSP